MSLLGLIYGSTVVHIILPFNMYSHFRHLQTCKAKMELVLRITRVIILIYTVLEQKKFQKREDKTIRPLCYSRRVTDMKSC